MNYQYSRKISDHEFTRLKGMSSDENSHSDNDGFDDGIALQEAKPKLKKPRMYKVVLINDDFTPMEFVVHVLERYFRMDREKAMHIMLHVHTDGRGLCGIFNREIAETKVAQVNDYSRSNNHPLLCTMETT